MAKTNIPLATQLGRRQAKKSRHQAVVVGRASTSVRQPDFGIWFNAKVPRRIWYEIRDGANQPHDITYLSSYIHDARTAPSLVTLAKGQLRVGLKSDCWELFGQYDELVSVPSVLRISPVLGFEWRFEHACLGRLLANAGGEASAGDELWISECFIEKGSDAFQTEYSMFHIKGGGGGWSFSVRLAHPPWKIILRDTQVPIGPHKL